MWPADARAFSRPTSKAREKRPGDQVEFSHNLERKQQSEKNKRQRKSWRGVRMTPASSHTDTLLQVAFLSNTITRNINC